jgi:ABC-type nitrate/sulfonate/bicarbonate transport system substrate-binding protein
VKHHAPNRGTRFLISSLAALMLAIISPVAATAIVDFPIGYSSRGGAYAFIALIDQQLLEQDGIRANFVYVGGPQISHALISGDIRMAILGPVTPLRAAAQGTDIRFIGGVTERESASLMADPKIAAAAGLKGTRLAIDRLGDTSDFRARKVLEALGLEAQKDVTLLQAGGQTARFAALKAGHAQSTIVDPPLTLVGRKMGFRELVKLTQLDFPSGAASIAVLRTTIDKQGKELQAIINAIGRALRVYKTEKDVAIRGLARFMQLNDREALEETWRAYAESYKDIPSPSVAGIKIVKDFLGQTDPNLRKLEMDKIIDTRFTSKLPIQSK